MNKSIFLLMAVAIAMAGCTKGLQQDPYADQPDSVKNAGPVTSKPTEKGQAEARDFLTVQADDNAEFAENEEGTITIKGSYNVDQIDGHKPVAGQDFVVAIANMTDFPGATFDSKSGEFKWTPKIGYVDERATKNAHLTASVTTKAGVIQQVQKDILISVQRAEVDPTIVSIDDIETTPTVEGTERDFKVKVRDPHGQDEDDLRPRLQIVSDNTSGMSGANLIYCKDGCANPIVENPSDPTLFTFRMVVGLKDGSKPKEVTKNSAKLNFGVIATSRFGEASGVKMANVSVITTVNDPIVAWSAALPLEMISGQANSTSFMVIDPSSDNSTITLTFSPSCQAVLGADAVCSCGPLSRAGALVCSIKWSPTTTGDYSLSFSTTNTAANPAGGSKTTQFPSRTLRVTQGSGTPGPGPIHTTPVSKKAGL